MSDHSVADIDAGKNFESIVDSNNKYSYTYDEIGIRTSMTIEWLNQYLINDEEIKIITLKPNDKETQNFSKKNSLFI